MPWPLNTDYVDAFQNPTTTFCDPGLRSGVVELDQLGLPKARDGQFATVFKVTSGGRDWAVKCFKDGLADRRDRYAAIDAHLNKVNLPCMAHFSFLDQGVRVRGCWYPVLKMEWVAGDLLDKWVERNVSKPDKLRALASQWHQIVTGLRTAGIGHGDLHHRNIVIERDQLRLIDYDSMFVPALAGRTSPECGHPNYQHPGRSGRHFGPYIDDFSAWVIYVSLVALSMDPGLWRRFGIGQETILFRRGDFIEANSSPLFCELLQAPDPRLRALALSLQSLLRLSPETLPGLGDGAVVPAGDVILVCGGCNQRLRIPLHSKVLIVKCPKCSHEQEWQPPPGAAVDNEWWRDHLGRSSAQAEQAAPASVQAAPLDAERGSDMSWVFESLSGQVPEKRFGRTFALEHTLLYTTFLADMALLLLSVALWMGYGLLLPAVGVSAGAIALVAANPVVWLTRYLRHPVRLERRSCERQLAALDRRIHGVRSQRRTQLAVHDEAERLHTKALRRLSKGKHRCDARLAAMLASATGRLDAAVTSLQRQLRDLDTQRTHELSSATSQIMAALTAERGRLTSLPGQESSALADLVRRERDELNAVNARVSKEVSDLKAKIAASPNEELAALKSALSALQQSFVQQALARESIDSHAIPGIGPLLKERLRYAGFIRASDVDYVAMMRVPGFGQTRINAVLAWKQQVAGRAIRRAPQTLSPAEDQRIRAEHQSRRVAWQSQLPILQDQLTRESEAIRRRFEGDRSRASQEFAVRRQRHEQEVQRLDRERITRERAVNDSFATRRSNVEVSLQGQETALHAARAAVHRAFQQELDALERDRIRLEGDHQRSTVNHKDVLERLKQEESSLIWQRAKQEHEWHAYRRIYASRYVRGVCGAAV